MAKFLVGIIIVLLVLGGICSLFYLAYSWISKVFRYWKEKKNQRLAEIAHNEIEKTININLKGGSIINCIECNGSGMNGTCQTCKGCGVNYAYINKYEERDACFSCHGSGIQRIKLDLGNKIVKCDTCNGKKYINKGYVSLYIQTYSEQVPKFRDLNFLNKPSIFLINKGSFYNSKFSGYGYYYGGREDKCESLLNSIFCNSQYITLGLEYYINNDKVYQHENANIPTNSNSMIFENGSKKKPSKSGSSSLVDLFAKLLRFGGAVSPAEMQKLQSLNDEYDANLEKLGKIVDNSPALKRILKKNTL